MLNAVLSSFRQAVSVSCKTSLVFVFVLLWLLINWKAMLLLAFDGAEIEARIASIEPMLTVQSMLLYPAIGALFYFGVYPLIAYLIFCYQSYVDKRKRLIKLKHDCELMQAEMKRAKLRARLVDSKYNSEVRIERDKLNYQYLMAERKYALKMRKLEYEAKCRQVLDVRRDFSHIAPK